MALKDVRHFYFSTLCQYLEEKQNLADFKEALEAGNITEEQMQDVMSAVDKLEENYHRLAYIMYLFSLPARKEKRRRFSEQYTEVAAEFAKLGVDENSITLENAEALKLFKAKLNELKKCNLD